MSRLVRYVLATVMLAPMIGISAPGADATVVIEVDREHPGARIDRNLFGQFAEHLGAGIYGGVWVGRDAPIRNVRGIRSDVVEALRALKVPNVRWPGGCFADEYHWRDGIGPLDRRRTTINANWGGAIETNAFGTEEFFDFLEQIGSEAYVSINVGSGSAHEASEWLDYLTSDGRTTAGRERAANGHPEPYRVPFVGIGNEAWGCGGAMTPEHYVEELKAYSRYTRNYNPAQSAAGTMRRIAVGPDGGHTEYTEAVMKAWHDRVWSWDIEGLSLHSYTSAGWPPAHPSTGFDTAEYALLLDSTLHMDALIAQHSTIMDRYDPDRKVALVVDEWGSWLAPLPGTNPGFLVQQNSLRDAILCALNFDIFARHADRVRMANIAQMVNVLQAMIMTDGEKLLLTPTYHVFRMYVPFQNATSLPVRFDAGRYMNGSISLPRLDVIAALDGDGVTWLALTNVDPDRPVTVDLGVAGLHANTVRGEVLTAARVDAVNTYSAPNAVAPRPISGDVRDGRARLELPAKSVTVVALR